MAITLASIRRRYYQIKLMISQITRGDAECRRTIKTRIGQRKSEVCSSSQSQLTECSMNIGHYSPSTLLKFHKHPYLTPINYHRNNPPPWRPHDQKYVAKRGEIGVSG